MKKISFILSLLLFLMACQQQENASSAEYIEDDTLKEILKEMHIADAIMGNQHWHDKDLNEVEKSYYNYIFKKYNITRQQFEENISPQMRETEDLLSLYDGVIAELQNFTNDTTALANTNEPIANNVEVVTVDDQPKDTLTNEELDELDEIAEALDDESLSEIEYDDEIVSVDGDIWRQQQSWSLPEEGEKELIVDNFKEVSHGTYTLKANIKLFADDESTNPRSNIQAFYEDGTYDEKRIYLKKDGVARDIVLTLKTNPGKVLNRVRVFLLNQNQSTSGRKHAEVKNIVFIYKP